MKCHLSCEEESNAVVLNFGIVLLAVLFALIWFSIHFLNLYFILKFLLFSL